MLSLTIALVWMFTVSIGVAESKGHSEVRAIPVHGIRKYGEACVGPGRIDSIYQAYEDLTIKNPAGRDDELKEKICQEKLGLHCIATGHKRKVDSKDKDAHQVEFTCQCFDPFYPDHTSSQIVYDHAAGECRAKARSPCVSGYYPEPDANIFWRYDREPFDTSYTCVEHAECKNVTESLAKVFLETLESVVCVCKPGFLPSDTGHCYYPNESEYSELLFASFVLLIVAFVFGIAFATIDSFRQSAFSPIASCSLKNTFNIDFLGFLDEPELPKHWYNSDGTEKSYNAIKQMLLIKKNIFEMKHTCFWKFGVFVRFEDDCYDVLEIKEYSIFQTRKRQMQEKRRLRKDKIKRKEYAINMIDKQGIKSEFTFVRNYQEKKRHYQIRSCLTEKNELFIRHIQEVPDDEFLKFMEDLSVPDDFLYSSYTSDHYEMSAIDYDEELDPSIIAKSLQESTDFNSNGFIKLKF